MSAFSTVGDVFADPEFRLQATLSSGGLGPRALRVSHHAEAPI